MANDNLKIYKRGNLIDELVLWCEAKPQERPRVNFKTRNVYQPKENQKQTLRELDYYLNSKGKYTTIKGPIIVDLFCFFKTRGKFDYPVSIQLGDVDNLAKAINDGLVSKKIIEDDKMIVAQEAQKIFDEEDSYIIIQIYEVKNEE